MILIFYWEAKFTGNEKFNPFPNYTDYAYTPPGFMLPLHITLTFLFAKGLLGFTYSCEKHAPRILCTHQTNHQCQQEFSLRVSLGAFLFVSKFSHIHFSIKTNLSSGIPVRTIKKPKQNQTKPPQNHNLVLIWNTCQVLCIWERLER